MIASAVMRAALWIGVLLPGVAAANGRAPGPLSLTFRPGAPGDVVQGTTFGALLSDDGGATWRWSCEQVAGYEIGPDPAWRWLDERTLVASTARGLQVTRDRGCSFEPAPGTEGRLVITVEVHPSDAATIYAILVDDDQRSALVRSRDGGRSFPETLLGPVGPDAVLADVEIAPSDPRHLYVRAMSFVPRGAAIHHSADAGETWDEHPFAGPLDFLLAVDAVDAETVHVAPRSPAALLRSDDAGRSFAPPLLATGGTVLALAVTSERIWLSETGGLHRSDDGGQSFTVVAGAPRGGCLAGSGTDLVACADPALDGYLVGASRDGAAFTPLLVDYAGIAGPLACAEGAPSRAVCDPRWPEVMAQLSGAPDAGVPDAAAPPPAPDRGCAVGGAGSPWIALLVYGALRRPRKA
jgi:hypothetical protein